MKKVFKLHDLDCANCAAKMENAIKKLDGVTGASVNFLTQKMTLETDRDSLDEIMEQVIKTCRRIEPDCVIER